MKDTNKVPSHVAIILDGNRRWARERGLPTFEGHRRGLDATDKIIKKALETGISCLTLWAFSTENWDRDPKEISYLMDLFAHNVDSNLKIAKKHNARIVHLGRKDRIPDILRKKITHAEDETKHFTQHYLSIALDYGGRDEILRAIQTLSIDVSFDFAKLDVPTFEKYLDTKHLPYPNPDLIIRTGGAERISGFMSWQSQYSELMFVEKFLPDFTPDDFTRCITDYQSRQRRFGK